MEFTIDAIKRLEFDSVLCDIVSQINASDQLTKYDYKEQVLKITVNDNLVRKMNPDQLSLLLKVKWFELLDIYRICCVPKARNTPLN